MESRRQQLLDQAWPTLDGWVKDRRTTTREAQPLSKVMTERSAATFVANLLRERTSKPDTTKLRERLGAAEVSTYDSTPPFRRLRCTLRVAGAAPFAQPEIDVLQQIGWENTDHRKRVEEWVDDVAAIENGFAWLVLDAAPRPLPSIEGPALDTWLQSAEPDTRLWIGGIARDAGHHLHDSIERIRTTGAKLLERELDAEQLKRCRKELRASEAERLWVLSSDPLTLDEEGTTALGTGALTLVPKTVVPPALVIVAALGVLDVVLLRDADPQLAWDVRYGHIELVLEQLLAVEVLRTPRAVWFVRPRQTG